MIKLELEINDVNLILGALSKLPFEQVIAIIDRIRQQGDPQVEALTRAADALAKAQETPLE